MQDLLIRKALFSVTDKTGLRSFAAKLKQIIPNIEFLASGNTAKTLKEANLQVKPIEEETAFPECFGGRIKTLHPRVAGGILYRRGVDDEEAKRLDIRPIDLVVCNLYAFEQAAQNPALSLGELFEQMDIGGSTLIRSACKNVGSTAVMTDPSDYPAVLQELEESGGRISKKTRETLALQALEKSASYEAALFKTFSSRMLKKQVLNLPLKQGRKLRYGENPDQEGWVYSLGDIRGVAGAEVLGGKALSYNNYEDASNAYEAAGRLSDLGAKHGAAVIKHGGICGYATGRNCQEAFIKAWNGDPKSAYGSVIALISEATDELIETMQGKFIEVLIAPAFSESFLAWAKQAKPNLRLLKTSYEKSRFCYRGIAGGLLVQTAKEPLMQKKPEIPTRIHPPPEKAGLFAFAVAAAAVSKSNAIAIAREAGPGVYQLLGVGAGQPNRIDSMKRLAIPKALETLGREGDENGLSECVLASDGFFPFADSIDAAADQSIRYCIQPGGSIHDKQVIEAADRRGLCMVFTQERYFNH